MSRSPKSHTQKLLAHPSLSPQVPTFGSLTALPPPWPQPHLHACPRGARVGCSSWSCSWQHGEALIGWQSSRGSRRKALPPAQCLVERRFWKQTVRELGLCCLRGFEQMEKEEEAILGGNHSGWWTQHRRIISRHWGWLCSLLGMPMCRLSEGSSVRRREGSRVFCYLAHWLWR